jgi:chitinase
MRLSWGASTDDVGVTGYEISIDGGAAIDVGDVLSSDRTGLTEGQSYSFRVRAYDAAGNRSAYSDALAGGTADVTAPSVPAMAAATGVTDTGITFNWTAATDNVGVTGYDLQIATDAGFTAIVSTHNLGAVLTYAKTGLTANTVYYARVRARDAAANTSAYSSGASQATTPAAPSGFVAQAQSDTEILLTIGSIPAAPASFLAEAQSDTEILLTVTP